MEDASNKLTIHISQIIPKQNEINKLKLENERLLIENKYMQNILEDHNSKYSTKISFKEIMDMPAKDLVISSSDLEKLSNAGIKTIGHLILYSKEELVNKSGLKLSTIINIRAKISDKIEYPEIDFKELR